MSTIYPIHGISIHALLAESDPDGPDHYHYREVFLSTLSLRRATQASFCIATFIGFLSTLSLRRATLDSGQCLQSIQNFYPRSPCGERPNYATPISFESLFLSTLSLRRATTEVSSLVKQYRISIHALLAESDSSVILHCHLHRISIHALLAESDGKRAGSRAN